MPLGRSVRSSTGSHHAGDPRRSRSASGANVRCTNWTAPRSGETSDVGSSGGPHVREGEPRPRANSPRTAFFFPRRARACAIGDPPTTPQAVLRLRGSNAGVAPGRTRSAGSAPPPDALRLIEHFAHGGRELLRAHGFAGEPRDARFRQRVLGQVADEPRQRHDRDPGCWAVAARAAADSALIRSSKVASRSSPASGAPAGRRSGASARPRRAGARCRSRALIARAGAILSACARPSRIATAARGGPTEADRLACGRLGRLWRPSLDSGRFAARLAALAPCAVASRCTSAGRSSAS